MMYLLTFIIGLVVGGFLGVVFMCLVQVSRCDHDFCGHSAPNGGKENEP